MCLQMDLRLCPICESLPNNSPLPLLERSTEEIIGCLLCTCSLTLTVSACTVICQKSQLIANVYNSEDFIQNSGWLVPLVKLEPLCNFWLELSSSCSF